MKKRLFKPRIIIILGPTASGKSDLAVNIAKKLNGEVISADSRQVYNGLDIGSGKITKREMRGVRHYLLDVASPKKVFTVAQYQKLGKRAIKDILHRGKLPIICGGTGLYIDALIYDKKFPAVPPNKKLRAKLEKLSTTELFVRIKKLDPERAKTIEKQNRRRLIRALEIIEELGKVPKIKTSSPYETLKIGIKLPRERLKKNITKRLEKRLKQGMVKEVENLHKSGVSWKRLDDLGLEYRYVSRYLRDMINHNTMKEMILRESWKYARRQMTWWRKDQSIHWISGKINSRLNSLLNFRYPKRK
ncbi:MAG: tRNA (adenosine(37)-N6)-dimethylallyltransferase MiaA [Candidatus Colwellbacteria bacterium]|nr:tRNA (adenosine(37)-N6)-dimethylallyltransferase MiaA [Candidatus Colwellbacteria bacterium]